MRLQEIIQFLETIAPPQLQESYDNAGLIIGNPTAEVRGVLVSLDALETIVEEAIARDCNLIVAHHPIIFKGLKTLTGKNYVERTVLKAIKNDIAIYAIHTNLDSVLRGGVNTKIAERLGLKNLKILSPKTQILMKLTTFVPKEATQRVLNALYEAGAGQVGEYKNCSFRTEGVGTFRPTGAASPYIGSIGQDEEVHEDRVEVIFPSYAERSVMSSLQAAHPYDEVAYYLHLLENSYQEAGSGIIGTLPEAMPIDDFLIFLKQQMQTACVRYTHPLSKMVQKIAVCGGSGSFLLGKALSAGADVFVTSDLKYHEFFDADGRIVIADIGHFESEQFTIDLLKDHLQNKFDKLLVFSTKKSTNPVNYL